MSLTPREINIFTLGQVLRDLEQKVQIYVFIAMDSLGYLDDPIKFGQLAFQKLADEIKQCIERAMRRLQ